VRRGGLSSPGRYRRRQKYPSRFLRSIDADWSLSSIRPSRSLVRVVIISRTISPAFTAGLSTAPVCG